MSEKVYVKSGAGRYPVVIGEGLDYGSLALEVRAPCRIVVVSDNNVFNIYGDEALKSFRDAGYRTSAYVVEPGESAKSMDVLARMLRYFADCDLDRWDMVASLGGGVVGDLAGFAAATYKRGIGLVQLPTSILAAVDSSVGGKTAVNLPEGKNLVGAFHSPLAVFCDTRVFKTLPKEVFADGMAEVIKHGMIGDARILLGIGSLPLEEIVRMNVVAKARIVGRDEYDTAGRMLLNFGHTVGHAVEALSGYGVSHGRAVAIGMSVITRAAEKAELVDGACMTELGKALAQHGLPTSCEYSASEISSFALRDKKRVGDDIIVVVPRRIGNARLLSMPIHDFEGFIARGMEA